MRRAAMLKAQSKAEVSIGDGLGDEVGSTVPIADPALAVAGGPEDGADSGSPGEGA